MAQTTRGEKSSTRDARDAMRLGAWASLACIAVLLAIITAQSENGLRRIAGIFGSDPTQTRIGPQLAIRPFDPETEARRLNEAVRVLAADRDRLLARIGTLERTLDTTGSIPPAAPAVTATPSPPPTLSAPETTVVPSAAQPTRAAAPAPTESVATRTEFGIDLGTSTTIEGLRTQWTAHKARQSTLLDGLRPIVAVRDGAKGVELRLIAGPVANAGVAARLCAVLSAGGLTCQPAVFDGQRLALQ